jgi:hypothetical protein
MSENRTGYKVLCENMKEGDLGIVGRVWTGFVWLRIGATVESSYEHSNEPSGSIT